MEIGEHRVVRRAPDGALYQWSNSSSTPSGIGWKKASKAEFPRVRSYLWFRDASNIQRDRENRKKREQAVIDTFSSKSAGERFSAMLTSKYWLSKLPQKPTERMEKNTRVKFDNRVHYVRKDVGDAVEIIDAITGDTKSVNHDELDVDDQIDVRYGRGDMVNITPGAIHPHKDVDAVILDFDEKSLQYRVAVGQTDVENVNPATVVGVYPESINALAQKVHENVTEVKQKMRNIIGGPFTEESKKVIDIVETAAKNGRSTVTEKEVYDTLLTIGDPVPKDKVAGTFASLKGYMPSSDYNSGTGVLFIRNSRDSLRAIRQELSIPRRVDDTAWKNLTGESKHETMVYEDQHVMTRDGAVDGMVKKIEGRMVHIVDKAGKQIITELNKLVDFKSRKQVIMDPSHPESFGKLNTSDIFWVLRDRDHCRDYKLGESVTLLPGLSVPGKKTTSFSARSSGKIKAILNDGTVRVQPDGGGQDWVVSPRQLLANKKFEDIGKLHQYVRLKRPDCYNRSLFVGEAEVSVGSHPGSPAGTKKITITFPHGKSYLDREDEFLGTAKIPGSGSLFARIPLLGNISGPDETLVPSKTLTDVISRCYPTARKITVARDRKEDGVPLDQSSEVTTVTFHIDNDKAMGRVVELDKLKEIYSLPKAPADAPASSLSDGYSIRMDLDKDKKRVVMRVGRDLERTEGAMPAILAERKYRDSNSGKWVVQPSSNLLFRDVVNATTQEKTAKWGMLPNSKDLINDSSVFTYDPATRLYSFDLGNYNKAHKFMQAFFGNETYERSMWETINGGFYARAHEKILASEAKECIDRRKVLDESKSNVEDFDDKALDGFFIPLRKYQNAAVHFANTRDAALLAMDQGTGKTFSSIAEAVVSLNKWKEEDPKRKRKVLIIAPASVAQTSWINSFKAALWPDNPGQFKGRKRKYGYTLLMGENRVEAYKKLLDPKDKTTFAVTSFETFANSDYKELKDVGFDHVIIDEAQTIKNSSDAAIIAQKIKMAVADATKKRALTGTPIENSPTDIQSILGWLDPESFGDPEKFLQDFVETDFVDTFDARGKKVKRAVGIDLKNKDALRYKLDELMFRIDKVDLLDPKSPFMETIEGEPNTITVEDLEDRVLKRYMKMPDGPAKQRLGTVSVIPKKLPLMNFKLKYQDNKLSLSATGDNPLFIENYPEYHRMVEMAKQQLRSEFMDMVKKGQKPNYNVIFTRLQQVMNDPSLVSDKMGLHFAAPVRNPKVDALVSHVKNHFANGDFSPKANGKILIFTYETKTVKFIEEQLTKAFPNLRGRILKFVGKGGEEDITRGELERKFNKDPEFKFPIMIANAAARTGVNLPTANFVINYDVGWNPQDLNQRIDRAHRVRSVKDIAEDAEMGLPPRNVFTTVLGVTSRTGDVNATIESRKLATHEIKQRVFDTIIKGKDPEKHTLGDDHAARAEALLGASNQAGDNRVDAREQRRFEIARYARADQRRNGGARSWFGYFTG